VLKDDKDNPSRQGQRTDFVYNESSDVHEVCDRPSGNSRKAALRRLRKDRPDIHARVLAGELTPHAGMIEVGAPYRAQLRTQADHFRTRCSVRFATGIVTVVISTVTLPGCRSSSATHNGIPPSATIRAASRCCAASGRWPRRRLAD
jgi:hypothetical protein